MKSSAPISRKPPVAGRCGKNAEAARAGMRRGRALFSASKGSLLDAHYRGKLPMPGRRSRPEEIFNRRAGTPPVLRQTGRDAAFQAIFP